MKTFIEVSEKLKTLGINFEVITFTDEVIAAREIDTSVDHNYDPKNAIKTLVIKTKDGFKAVVLKGSEKIDGQLLENIVGKWSVVDEDTLFEEFGFVPGTVCPLALDLPIIMDENVHNLDTLSMGTGEIKKGFNVKKDDVVAHLKFQTAKISKDEVEVIVRPVMTAEIENKMKLIKSVGEEIIGEDELITKLNSGKELVAYDGFEPSGRIHIAQGLLRAININKLTSQGIKFKMLVADWHSWANNKMGGDLDRIQVVGKYFIEVWKACGLDMSMVDFYWANDIVTDRNYWKIVMNIAIKSTIKRIVRCGTILGRKESEMRQASQIMAPLMQAADIFYLKADICQLGIDQRKVNMLAREVAPELGFEKPIIISHHLLLGLGKPPENMSDNPEERAIALKMSKSKPDSAIFMTDNEDEVASKIKKAYCPPNQITENPVLEYFRYIVFGKYSTVEIKRESKYGGDVVFNSYSEMEKAYAEGQLFPLDLKDNLVRYINEMLLPIRKHFEENIEAKKLKELVDGFMVTR